MATFSTSKNFKNKSFLIRAVVLFVLCMILISFSMGWFDTRLIYLQSIWSEYKLASVGVLIISVLLLGYFLFCSKALHAVLSLCLWISIITTFLWLAYPLYDEKKDGADTQKTKENNSITNQVTDVTEYDAKKNQQEESKEFDSQFGGIRDTTSQVMDETRLLAELEKKLADSIKNQELKNKIEANVKDSLCIAILNNETVAERITTLTAQLNKLKKDSKVGINNCSKTWTKRDLSWVNIPSTTQKSKRWVTDSPSSVQKTGSLAASVDDKN